LGELVYGDGTSGFEPNLMVPASSLKGEQNPAFQAAIQLSKTGKFSPPSRARLAERAPPLRDNTYDDMQYPPAEYRVLAAFRVWAVINYFFPYKEFMGEDWNETLRQFARVVLLFFSKWLQYLQHCVLAGIVFTIAIGLIDVKSLYAIRRESPGELTLALVTAIAVVVIGVEDGILLAVALSLLRHVRHSYHPHTMILAPTAATAGRWAPVPAIPGTETAPGLIVYRFGADLFFANDHFFIDDVRHLLDRAPTPVRWFIIDAGAITDLDYSAARTLAEFCEGLKQRGINVLFARVNQYLRADMDRHGITAVLGETHLFETLHTALVAAGFDPSAASSTH